MRALTLLAILILTGGNAAQAGAWLRSEGGGFASSDIVVNEDREVSGSIYVEYGLSETRTLGADLYYGVDRTGTLEGSGILFLRAPLGATDQTHKFAAHVGLGARSLNNQILPAAEVGLSWGRGFKLGDRYGWLNVDGSYNATQRPAADRIKLDATAGLGMSERTKVMLQLFNTFQDDDAFIKLAPSLLLALGAKGTTLQLGAEVPLEGGGTASVRVGLWREW